MHGVVFTHSQEIAGRLGGNEAMSKTGQMACTTLEMLLLLVSECRVDGAQVRMGPAWEKLRWCARC